MEESFYKQTILDCRCDLAGCSCILENPICLVLKVKELIVPAKSLISKPSKNPEEVLTAVQLVYNPFSKFFPS